jgi:hypothetical protein
MLALRATIADVPLFEYESAFFVYRDRHQYGGNLMLDSRIDQDP